MWFRVGFGNELVVGLLIWCEEVVNEIGWVVEVGVDEEGREWVGILKWGENRGLVGKVR